MDVRRVVAAVLLLGLLVGCSDDEPSGRAEPTESATVSPTPTDETRAPTGPGARAFVGYWIASFNYAMQTGDTAGFRQLFREDCEGCLKIVRLIEAIYRPGGHVESDGWRIRHFIRTSLAGNSEASVRALITLSPELIHRAGDEKPDRRSGGQATATFSLSRSNGAWRVTKIVQGNL